MKIIDAHSHIDYISHNVQPAVVATVCCATCESEWQNLINITNVDKNVYGASGVHPWFVADIKDGFELRLENLLKSNDSFMIGEIGLDKYKPDMDKQIDVFQKQFEIAIKLKRSVFLHCVGAWDKILHILKQYKKSELPMIVAHGFNGSVEILDTLINNGNVFISFNKIVPEYIQNTPINKILVETDGKNNIVLSDMVDKISNIKSENNAGEIIYENTLKVLKNEQIA